MNKRNHDLFKEHVRKLLDIALTCDDMDRRGDARRSLSCMVLLRTRDSDPEYPGKVLPLVEQAVLMLDPAMPSTGQH